MVFSIVSFKICLSAFVLSYRMGNWEGDRPCGTVVAAVGMLRKKRWSAKMFLFAVCLGRLRVFRLGLALWPALLPPEPAARARLGMCLRI